VDGSRLEFGRIGGIIGAEGARSSGMSNCPLKLGQRVMFTPDERAIGWSYPTFDRVRLKPGDAGTITRIDDNGYIYLDDERGGFHWECFLLAD
jgi:hypothetical protein